MIGGMTHNMLPHQSEGPHPPPCKQALVTTARADLKALLTNWKGERL